VDERNAAQAVQLIRALRNQLHEMTRQLSRLERQGVIGRTAGYRPPSGTKRLRCGETLARHSFSLTA
jgi:hypothetical protein